MGKGKALLSRKGGQKKFLLGMERGRSTEVEDDWDYPPVLKLISFMPLLMTISISAGAALVYQQLRISKALAVPQ
jgi:hypothetical protein